MCYRDRIFGLLIALGDSGKGDYSVTINQNMKTTAAIVMCLLISLVGCQTGEPMKAGVMDNASFMNLWKTYSHCQNTANFEQLKQDTVVLSTAAKRSLSQDAFVLPLPGKLEQLVATPSARLAVDVKAMSAACSLRAGQAAVETQRFDIARELLQGILEYDPQSEYAFYSLQAKAILSELEPASVQISLKLP
jgi:hypothetical protein